MRCRKMLSFDASSIGALLPDFMVLEAIFCVWNDDTSAHRKFEQLIIKTVTILVIQNLKKVELTKWIHILLVVEFVSRDNLIRLSH